MITATFSAKQNYFKVKERLEFAEDNLQRIEAKGPGVFGTKEHEEAQHLYKEALAEYNTACLKYRP